MRKSIALLALSAALLPAAALAHDGGVYRHYDGYHHYHHWHDGGAVIYGAPYYSGPYYTYPDYAYATPYPEYAPSAAPYPDYAPSAGQQQYCREYTDMININGRTQPMHGTACLQPDGSWQKID